VWLTEPGRALIRDLLPVHAAQVHALLVGMPGAQRRELRRLLGALRKHLSADADEAKQTSEARRARA
jgi:DNA-binding MarR family transcriptional regulator